MAREQVKCEQDDVDKQHQCADADAKVELLIGTRKPEGTNRVIPEKAQKDDGAVEKIAMKILQDERKAGLAAIIAMRRLTHGAARRIQKECAVIGFAIVVTGHAEAQRERQDQ